MPTPAERLATLEAVALENRRDLDELRADIHGGPGVEWNRSIRGRLHAMQSTLQAADKLAEAAREVRRAQDSQRTSRIKSWQWTVLAACSIVGATTPYVILLLGH